MDLLSSSGSSTPGPDVDRCSYNTFLDHGSIDSAEDLSKLESRVSIPKEIFEISFYGNAW